MLSTQEEKTGLPKVSLNEHIIANSSSSLKLDSKLILQRLIFVRYQDHVLYNRSIALSMQPQIRETVGWLIYEAEQYIILSWDRDADPPTLRGGDPKASGLVLLKSDILQLQYLKVSLHILQNNPSYPLNRKHTIQEAESAFRPSERKTHSTSGEKTQ